MRTLLIGLGGIDLLGVRSSGMVKRCARWAGFVLPTWIVYSNFATCPSQEH